MSSKIESERVFMNPFSDAREAKEFLVSSIVGEAQRENVPLSEVERKMLYFSETGWTLPNIMEVNDEFERDYDTPTYEKKIARLITAATKRARKENPEEFTKWTDAIRKLNEEDHYITVMFDMAGVSTGRTSTKWKIAVLALAAGCLVVAIGPILRYLGLGSPRATGEFGSLTVNERLGNFVGYAWACLAVLCLGGLVYSHFDRERRLYKLFNRALGGVFRLFGSRKRAPLRR